MAIEQGKALLTDTGVSEIAEWQIRTRRQDGSWGDWFVTDEYSLAEAKEAGTVSDECGNSWPAEVRALVPASLLKAQQDALEEARKERDAAEARYPAFQFALKTAQSRLVTAQSQLAEKDREIERLSKFADFVLLWVERGPPHGGPGNEATVLDAIRHHPILSTRRASLQGLLKACQHDREGADADRSTLQKRLEEVEGALTSAAVDVFAERRRQVDAEGWTPEHDDKHTHSEMALAAACYALPPTARSIPFTYGQDNVRQRLWPWDIAWWKPKDRRSDLVRAGALILAEIERLDRASLHPKGESNTTAPKLNGPPTGVVDYSGLTKPKGESND